MKTKHLQNKLDAGGKPSTWFPPEGLVEQSALTKKQERKQEHKQEQAQSMGTSKIAKKSKRGRTVADTATNNQG